MPGPGADGERGSALEEGSARSGFGTFLFVGFGQLVSLFGSSLTAFGLGIWVFQQTGSVLGYGLIALFAVLPGTLLSPLAGALVDRWDRRWTLIGSDTLQALATGALLLLSAAGRLEVWQVYGLAVVVSAAGAFQVPAFQAATTMLVPKRHLARASGMVHAGMAAAQILAPLTAGAILATSALPAVLLLDLVTFAAAFATLLAVRIPRPRRSAAGAAGRGSLAFEITFGLRYLQRQPGLLSLLLLFAGVNLSTGLVQVLIPPLVLSFASPAVLGWVLSVATFGMLLGGLTMAVWGGPRRRVAGILAFLALAASALAVGGLAPSAWLVAASAAIFLFTVPVVNALSQAIWQSKVEPDLQGRIFSLRRVAAGGAQPLAFLLAGALADHVFEPLMAPEGALAGSLGRFLGVGAGRGMGLMITLSGLLLLGYLAYLWFQPRLRRLEEEVPDAVGELPAVVTAVVAVSR